MKKTIVCVALAAMILTGCGKIEKALEGRPPKDGDEIGKADWLISVMRPQPLVYAKDTKILYYIDYSGVYGVFAVPYYNEQGKICRYIDGQIVPVE